MAWRSRASSCARAWRLDDPPPLPRVAAQRRTQCGATDARGPPQRSGGSAMKWPRGSWHAVAGRVRPLGAVRFVRPLLRGPRLPDRTAARRQCPAESYASADHDGGDGRTPCEDRLNNGGSRPHCPCAFSAAARRPRLACQIAVRGPPTNDARPPVKSSARRWPRAARRRRNHGELSMLRVARPAPDPERGGPLRGDRPNAATDSLMSGTTLATGFLRQGKCSR